MDVISDFKLPTRDNQEGWADDGRFNDNGQFTMYLATPYDTVKIKAFIDKLQAFLTDLGVAPDAPMATDYAIGGVANISMRLERIDDEYIDSLRLTTDPRSAQAFHLLQQDTVFYSIFADDDSVQRRTHQETDFIHHLFSQGFWYVYDDTDPDLGEYFQQLAVEFRCALSRGEELPFKRRCELLTGANRRRLKKIDCYEGIRKWLTAGMSDSQKILLDMYDYVNKHSSNRQMKEIFTQLSGSLQRGADLPFADKCAFLTGDRREALEASGFYRDVYSLLAKSMTDTEKTVLALDVFIDHAMTQAREERGMTARFTQLFSAGVSTDVQISAARKVWVKYEAGERGGRLVLTKAEKQACLQGGGALWHDVIEPYGLKGLVDKAVVREQAASAHHGGLRLTVPVGRGI